MQYIITFKILGKYEAIFELEEFLVDQYKELKVDASRIIIISKTMNRQLIPDETIFQILQNQNQDIFDVGLINIQSLLQSQQLCFPTPSKDSQSQFKFNNYPFQQKLPQFDQQSQNILQAGQLYQSQNSQQNFAQHNQQQNQSISQEEQQQIITLKLQYNNKVLKCELQLNTCLETLSQLAAEKFEIKGKVLMLCKNENLSNLPGSTQLQDIKINNDSTIQILYEPQQQQVQQLQQTQSHQQQQKNQEEFFRVQLEIEYGTYSHSFVLSLNPNQKLLELKQQVLNLIGIEGYNFADVDFYQNYSVILLGPKELEKTFAELNLNQDYIKLLAKVRNIGG